MEKQINFNPCFSKEDIEDLYEEIKKAREKNKKIIEEITRVELKEEYFPNGDFQTGDMLRFDFWKSNLLPEFPIIKKGIPSSLEFTDEELYKPKTEKSSVYYNIFVFYFDNGPKSKEGETDGCDCYEFFGFERDEIKECAERIAESWEMNIYEKNKIGK